MRSTSSPFATTVGAGFGSSFTITTGGACGSGCFAATLRIRGRGSGAVCFGGSATRGGSLGAVSTCCAGSGGLIVSAIAAGGLIGSTCGVVSGALGPGTTAARLTVSTGTGWGSSPRTSMT